MAAHVEELVRQSATDRLLVSIFSTAHSSRSYYSTRLLIKQQLSQNSRLSVRCTSKTFNSGVTVMGRNVLEIFFSQAAMEPFRLVSASPISSDRVNVLKAIIC